jgi:hypothetical protein
VLGCGLRHRPAAQVAKNIVLAGVGNVAIMDSTPCKAYPRPSFLLTTDAAADQRCGVLRCTGAPIHMRRPAQ